MAADDVGLKNYGESCPWLYDHGFIGHRTAVRSYVGEERRFFWSVKPNPSA